MKTDLHFEFEKKALDTALSSGSASVTFPTPGKAVAFRQRCYAFRKWKRDTMGAHSPYELLTIKSLAKGALTVEIAGRTFEGTIVPGTGAPIVASQSVEDTPSIDLSEDDFGLLDAVKQKVGL